MQVFLSNVPPDLNADVLEFLLKPLAAQLQIYVFDCWKPKAQKFAFLTFADADDALKFLTQYKSGSGHLLPPPMQCRKSSKAADHLLVKCLQREKAELLRDGYTVEQRPIPARHFAVKQVAIGIWHYIDGELVFLKDFARAQRSWITAGRNFIEIVTSRDDIEDRAFSLKVPYEIVDCIVRSQKKRSYLYITLCQTPALYEGVLKRGSPPLHDVEQQFPDVVLENTAAPNYKVEFRVPCPSRTLNSALSLCHVYRLEFYKSKELTKICSHFEHLDGAPNPINAIYANMPKTTPIARQWLDLCRSLRESMEYRSMPFCVAFQLQRLAQNSYLHPETILSMIPEIEKMTNSVSNAAIADSISTVARRLPPRGPNAAAFIFEPQNIIKAIKEAASSFDVQGSLYAIAERTEHLAMIHRVYISPLGMYLDGPYLEAMNRVLRKYSSHEDHFVRVSFVDEDFGHLRNEYGVQHLQIYNNRFTSVLNNVIPILGRGYKFLGFSNSSLRTRQCWFMAPFDQNGTLMKAPLVIVKLGDFSHFTCPARCAARIGQAFSDSTGTVKIAAESELTIEDVMRAGRCFTDGVGKISQQLLDDVWRQHRKIRQTATIALQIRYKGAKGMVALDPNLRGKKLVLRPSMIKFSGSEDDSLEITGTASHSLKMYLNRDLIKILEDLGVPDSSFLHLQDLSVDQLRTITKSSKGAALFMREFGFGGAASLPELLLKLVELDIDFMADNFIRASVQLAIFTRLREIKYKARIPVKGGYTLYGVVDETGTLRENEIFVAIRDEDWKETHVLEADVLITRSPQKHPGDVRRVKAVKVPEGSPLLKHHNVVVFSQLGERDLPSMLAGGDLDGDLFNVIWDTSLIPSKISAPAEYPKVAPTDIGRTVRAEDITSFFVQFMTNDMLGLISNLHLLLADQGKDGTFEPGCLKLAELASTAVDYAKTGIPADMHEIPSNINRRCKPDFMKRAPQLVLDTRHGKTGASYHWSYESSKHEDQGAYIPGALRVRYYESPKILGKLFRSIDEAMHIENMEQSAKDKPDSSSVMDQLLQDVLCKTKAVKWQHHLHTAVNIRRAYEHIILDLAYSHSNRKAMPLTELEVFTGVILAKSDSLPDRRERDACVDLRARLALQIKRVTDWMLKGKAATMSNGQDQYFSDESDDEDAGVSLEEYMDCVSINDGGYVGDVSDEEQSETLPRCIACFYVSMHDEITGLWHHIARDPQFGQVQSFKYLAANVCLSMTSKKLGQV